MRGVGLGEPPCRRSYECDWPEFVEIVEKLQANAHKDSGAAALLLICYVWVRSATALTVERREIAEDGWWTIPPSKIKGARIHRLPLDHELTQELLATRPATGTLFRARAGRPRPDGRLGSLHRATQRYLPENLGPHGLRHVGATLCEGIGVPRGDISYVLHHKIDRDAPAVTLTYVKSHSDPIVYETVHTWLDALEIALELGDKANATEIVDRLRPGWRRVSPRR